MGKCLITKLSSSVNNSSLLKLGEIKVFKKAGGNISPYSFITVRENSSIESLGSGIYKTQSFTEKYGQKCTLNGNEVLSFYIKIGRYLLCTE